LKAVKRLLKEAQELKNPTELFFAQPLDVSYLINNSGLTVLDLLIYIYI
jgi:hypothetical protein